jgi:hypothetical protein
VINRPVDRRRVYEIATGALATLAIEFGVAVILLAVSLAAAALIVALAH